jgi:hypothetical protein
MFILFHAIKNSSFYNTNINFELFLMFASFLTLKAKKYGEMGLAIRLLPPPSAIRKRLSAIG